MPQNRTIRFWHVFRREPSANAELPIAVASLFWSIGASLDPTVLHPQDSWIMPGSGFILGCIGICGCGAKRALRTRLFAAFMIAIFWVLLAYAAYDIRGIKAYIACYLGMAFAEILSTIELSGALILDRYAAGGWLPPRMQAAIDRET